MDRPASLPPQKFREIVFQLIYSHDFGGDEEVVDIVMAELRVSKNAVRRANAVKEKFLEKKAEVDLLIAENSQSYDLDRIPRVEKNVIRLGVYELLCEAGVPPKVVIAEAMRLARKFSTDEAAGFVNALLDGIYKKLSAKPQRDLDAEASTCQQI